MKAQNTTIEFLSILAVLSAFSSGQDHARIGYSQAVACQLQEETFPLRPGWILVEGGEDLIRNAYWGCPLQGASVDGRIEVVDGTLVSVAGNGFIGGINLFAPHFEVRGDFGILITMLVAEGQGGSISVVGSLQAGTEWWQGMKRLDVGMDNSMVQVGLWDGTQSSPVLFRAFNPGPIRGEVVLEATKQGSQFIIYVNQAEVGRINDMGIFDSGAAYLGWVVPPHKRMTVSSLAVEVPEGQETNVQLRSPLGPVTVSSPDPTLRSLAQARGLTIGVQIPASELVAGRAPYTDGKAEEIFRQVLVKEFNTVVSAQALFRLVHPSRNRYNFCGGDAIVAFAKANNMPVFGHNLVWQGDPETWLPDWLTQCNFLREELIQILREHIQTVVSHYRGQLSGWDVVNEVVEYDGNLRDTIWLRGIGPEYIEMAFRWAREADPNVKLFLNEFGAEGLGPKSDAVYNLVRSLNQRGVPIDGVGFQSHFSLDPQPDAPSLRDVTANMRRLNDLGLEVHISEMDVRMQPPFTAAKLNKQADVYRNLLRACLRSPNCHSFVMWGINDEVSWINGAYPGFDSATIFDEMFRPKPAYFALLDELRGR